MSQKKRIKICTVENCGRRTRGRELCEAHYYRQRRNSKLGLSPIQKGTNCFQCGAQLSGKKLKCCSSKCSTRHNRGTPEYKICKHCGKPFKHPGENNVTCSIECEIYWDRELVKHAPSYCRGRKRYKAHKLEDFTRQEIFERDEWHCHLCLDEIPKDLRWPHPLSATIDHCVPISRGGVHTRKNVRAAHLRCNMKKGNRQKLTDGQKLTIMARYACCPGLEEFGMSCGKRVKNLNEWEFDHIFQLSESEDNSVENLRILCKSCHRQKSFGPGGSKRITTAGSDSNRRAKIRRNEVKWATFTAGMKDETKPEKKSRWPSRPFPRKKKKDVRSLYSDRHRGGSAVRCWSGGCSVVNP